MGGKIVFASDSDPVIIPKGISLSEYICRGIIWNSRKLAIVDGVTGKSFTYQQVRELCTNVGSGLFNLGIRKGDTVMLLLPNCPEYPILFLGIISIGAVVTTANPSYGQGEISRQVKDSGTKIVITLSSIEEKLNFSNVQVILLDGEKPGKLSVSYLFSTNGIPPPKVHISDDDTCVLPYSSGTTGLSKGVMLTHQNLIANVAQILGGRYPRKDIGPEDVVLSLLPMFHIYSITIVNLCSLKSGCTLVSLPRFDLDLLLHVANKYKITVAPIVPPIILLLTKSKKVKPEDWSSLRLTVSGAAPLDAELELAFQRKFPNVIVGQGYGMTESSPTVTVSPSFQKPTLENGREKRLSAVPGSVGTLLPNTEAMIVDPSTGKSLGVNQRGELWIRGPQVMKGYLNNPEATSATVDGEGWLRTGDVALIDPKGNVFVVDRVKELIKVKGFQVPPAELEGILVSHPEIADAAVLGKPDDLSGEVPVAFVVKVSKSSTLTKEEVLQFIASQVVTYKKLHAVVFVESIPKSASGKILRRELKSRL